MKKKVIQVLFILVALSTLTGCSGCGKDKKKNKKADEANKVETLQEAKPTKAAVKEEPYKDAEGVYVYAYTDEIDGVQVTANYWIELAKGGKGRISTQDLVYFTWDGSGDIVYEDGAKQTFKIEDNDLVLTEGESIETRFSKMEGNLIMAEPITIDSNNIPDGEYAAEIVGSEIKEENGKLIIPASIYVEEVYNAEDIELAKSGDAIIVDGAMYIIDETYVDGDTAYINGGNDMGGVILVKDYDDPVYKYRGFDDIGSYAFAFKQDFEADEETFMYNDFSSLESVLTADYYSLLDFVSDEYLSEYCTRIEIYDKKITSVTRNFMP